METFICIDFLDVFQYENKQNVWQIMLCCTHSPTRSIYIVVLAITFFLFKHTVTYVTHSKHYYCLSCLIVSLLFP